MYQYRWIKVGAVKVGDEIRAADGKTWLPPIRHSCPGKPYGTITLLWWGSSANERRPDSEMLSSTIVRVRRLRRWPDEARQTT